MGPASSPAGRDRRDRSTLGLWVERLRSDSLFRNGAYIMGTFAAPALLGFVFWIVAARVLPTVEVGRAAALVSAMLLVSIVTNLGIGQVFVSRLASRSAGHEWSITVTSGLAVTAAASLAGGTVAAALLPVLEPSLSTGVGAASFIIIPLGVAAVACSLVVDHACIAERHAKPAFVRNTAAAAIRLILIAGADAVPVNGTVWILSAWLASFLLIDAHAVTRVLPSLGHDFKPTLSGWHQELAKMRGLIIGHQAINLGAQATWYVLPLIVTARLGPEQNAYFYATFMVATSMFFIAPAISDSLFAEGVHRPQRLFRDLRRAASYIIALAGPAALVLVIAGDWILGLFGSQYADAGDTLLLIFVASVAFDAVRALSVAVLRARGQLREGAIATFAMFILTIGSVWLLLPPMGLEGAGVGWGIGKVGGMCLALLFIVRGPRSARGHTVRTGLAEARRGP